MEGAEVCLCKFLVSTLVTHTWPLASSLIQGLSVMQGAEVCLYMYLVRTLVTHTWRQSANNLD